MAIQIIRKNQQARGQFNGGEILENKPIGFPREGGHLRPYSNLFYWAHAWSEKGSTIPLHPHQGFEIMSFVLKGSIEHFDTKLNKWITLNEGAAQIIRAGNGISHSEKINEGAHMFQIWFDPNLESTLQIEATYDDYTLNDFPLIEKEGMRMVKYKGENSPLMMSADVKEIERITFSSGSHIVDLEPKLFHSFYVISGEVELTQETLTMDDFFIISEEEKIQLRTNSETTLFKISSPLSLDYKTYAQRVQESIQ